MSTSAALCFEWTYVRFPRLTKALDWLGRLTGHLILVGKYAGDYEPPADLVMKTQAVWGRRLKREVPEAEARTIIREFRNLISLLKEIKANGK